MGQRSRWHHITIFILSLFIAAFVAIAIVQLISSERAERKFTQSMIQIDRALRNGDIQKVVRLLSVATNSASTSNQALRVLKRYDSLGIDYFNIFVQQALSLAQRFPGSQDLQSIAALASLRNGDIDTAEILAENIQSDDYLSIKIEVFLRAGRSIEDYRSRAEYLGILIPFSDEDLYDQESYLKASVLSGDHRFIIDAAMFHLLLGELEEAFTLVESIKPDIISLSDSLFYAYLASDLGYYEDALVMIQANSSEEELSENAQNVFFAYLDLLFLNGKRNEITVDLEAFLQKEVEGRQIPSRLFHNYAWLKSIDEMTREEVLTFLSTMSKGLELFSDDKRLILDTVFVINSWENLLSDSHQNFETLNSDLSILNSEELIAYYLNRNPEDPELLTGQWLLENSIVESDQRLINLWNIYNQQPEFSSDVFVLEQNPNLLLNVLFLKGQFNEMAAIYKELENPQLESFWAAVSLMGNSQWSEAQEELKDAIRGPDLFIRAMSYANSSLIHRKDNELRTSLSLLATGLDYLYLLEGSGSTDEVKNYNDLISRILIHTAKINLLLDFVQESFDTILELKKVDQRNIQLAPIRSRIRQRAQELNIGLEVE